MLKQLLKADHHVRLRRPDRVSSSAEPANRHSTTGNPINCCSKPRAAADRQRHGKPSRSWRIDVPDRKPPNLAYRPNTLSDADGGTGSTAGD
jgi:hypothetical protein